MQMFRHIVLIKWKEGVSREQIDGWIQFCNRIPDECPMVYNWCSSPVVAAPEPDRASTHEYCITFDLRSREEWAQYLKHPCPEEVYSRGMSVIDLERTASTNMLVEAEPLRTRSQVLSVE